MNKEKNPLYHCRVCGIFQDDPPPWREDGLCSTHETCFCCGIEFGYEDGGLQSIRRARELWLENGAKWDSPSFKPDMI